MGCRNLHSLLSSQGDLDAGGSQVAGEAFVPEPPGGCGFGLQKVGERLGSEHVGRAGRLCTDSSGEGWSIRNCQKEMTVY